MKSKILYAHITFTGGLILGLELLSSRLMIPFFGVSLYVWSAILCVTLLALAIGYRFGGYLTNIMSEKTALLFFAGSAALSSLWVLFTAWTYPFIFRLMADFDLVSGSIIACLYLIFLPLLVLSALNPVLVSILNQKDMKADESNDYGAGTVMFVSTVGSVAGIFIVAHGLLPYLTNYQSLMILCVFGAALSVAVLLCFRDFSDRQFVKTLGFSVIVLILSAATLFSGGLERLQKHSITTPKGQWHIQTSIPSYFGNVMVADFRGADANHTKRYLLNDGLFQNIYVLPDTPSTQYTYALEKLALSINLEQRERALVLGLGAGVVPSRFRDMGMAVDVVEINPKMFDVARDYFGFDDRGMRIFTQDARTAVRRCDEAYDIVVIDLFNGDGVPAHLITREFFMDIAACMTDGAVVVMNNFLLKSDRRAQHYLIKTVANVWGPVWEFTNVTEHEHAVVNSFLMARHKQHFGSFRISMDGIPRPLYEAMAQTFQNRRLFDQNSPDLADAAVITDMSNNWKRYIYPAEQIYRKGLRELLPTALLIN